MFSKITKAISALKAGESLKSSAAWKNVQTATNAVVVIITFILTLFPDLINMSEDDIYKLAGVVVTLVGLGNAYITNATSNKVGTITKEKTE